MITKVEKLWLRKLAKKGKGDILAGFILKGQGVDGLGKQNIKVKPSTGPGTYSINPDKVKFTDIGPLDGSIKPGDVSYSAVVGLGKKGKPKLSIFDHQTLPEGGFKATRQVFSIPDNPYKFVEEALKNKGIDIKIDGKIPTFKDMPVGDLAGLPLPEYQKLAKLQKLWDGVKSKSEKAWNWTKDHKKGLAITGGGVGLGTGLTWYGWPYLTELASDAYDYSGIPQISSVISGSDTEDSKDGKSADKKDTEAAKESTESFKHWGALSGGALGGVGAALAAWELSKKRSDWERWLYSGLAAAGGAAAGGYAGSLLDE